MKDFLALRTIPKKLLVYVELVDMIESSYKCATHSISTSVFIGSSLTATQVRHWKSMSIKIQETDLIDRKRRLGLAVPA